MYSKETRAHVDLESHWAMKERPSAKFSLDPKKYEESLEDLLDKYPCPNDYIKTTDIIGTDKIIKEF